MAAENVVVAIRWRPLIKREIKDEPQDKTDWEWSEKTIRTKNSDKEWTYDRVFGVENGTKDVYEEIVKPIVKQAIKGYNGTVFAYGQTGSGKTFTMRGCDNNPGIIPLAIKEIAAAISENPEREFMMAMNYIEIYNEQIRDLLADTTNKKYHIIEKSNGEIVVEGIQQEIVGNEEDILAFLTTGDNRRATAATNMNEHSSRSHAIFRLRIESRAKGEEDDCITTSQINLVDLAGSERASQTGASGQTLKEGCHINKSLFMLGRVINDLTSNSPHIPYRDSVLTRILQPALGGNAKTAIIATVTQSNGSFVETKSTLGFASSAKMIKNTTNVNYTQNAQANDALLIKQRREIDRLNEECNRLRTEKSGTTNETATDDRVDEYKERIRKLQQMVLNGNNSNNGSEVPRKKKVMRRQTWHPNQRNIENTFPKRESETVIKEEDSTFFDSQSTNVLDRLDEDYEYRLIDKTRPNKRSLNELSPSKLNVQKKLRYSPTDQFSQAVAAHYAADLVCIKSDIKLPPFEKSMYRDDTIRKLELQIVEQKKELENKNVEHQAALEKIIAFENDGEKSIFSAAKSIDTFDATKLMEELESENITLKNKIDAMEESYNAKVVKLDAKLNAIGNATTTDNLINEIKSLHAQLQDRARQSRQLEDKVDEKNEEIRFLNEQIQDVARNRSDPVNNSTIDDFATMKIQLEELARALQKEEQDKLVANERIIALESELEESRRQIELPIETSKPGDKTQAFEAAAEAIDMCEEQKVKLAKYRTTCDDLQLKVKQLEEDLEFARDEKMVFEGVNEELDSLKVEHFSLKSEVENSRLSGLSSMNDSILRRSETAFAELEAARDVLQEKLIEKTNAMTDQQVKISEFEKTNTEKINEISELTIQLEMERSKSSNRIKELTKELDHAWKPSTEIDVATANTQTDNDSVHISCQATVESADCSVATTATNTADFTIQTDLVDIKFLNGQLLHKSRELTQAESTLETLRVKIGEQIIKIETSIAEIATKTEDILQLRDEAHQKNAELVRAQQACGDHQTAISEKQLEIDNLVSRISNEERKNGDLLNNIQNLKTVTESVEKHKQEALNEMTERLGALEVQLKDKKDALENVERMFKECQMSLATVHQATNAVEQEKQALASELCEAKQRLGKYEEQIFKEPADPKPNLSDLGIVDVSFGDTSSLQPVPAVHGKDMSSNNLLTNSDLSAMGICEEYDVTREYDVIESTPSPVKTVTVDTVSADVHEVKLQQLKHDNDQLQVKITEMTSVQVENETLIATIAELKMVRTQLESEVTSLTTQVGDLQTVDQMKSVLETQLAELKSKLSISETSSADCLDESLATMKQELALSQETNTGLLTTISELKAENSKLSADKTEISTVIERLTNEKELLQSENSNLAVDKRNHDVSIDSKDTLILEQRNSVEVLQNEVKSQAVQMSQESDAKKEIEMRFATLCTEHEALLERYQLANDAFAASQTERKNYLSTIESLKEQLSILESEKQEFATTTLTQDRIIAELKQEKSEVDRIRNLGDQSRTELLEEMTSVQSETSEMRDSLLLCDKHRQTAVDNHKLSIDECDKLQTLLDDKISELANSDQKYKVVVAEMDLINKQLQTQLEVNEKLVDDIATLESKAKMVDDFRDELHSSREQNQKLCITNQKNVDELEERTNQLAEKENMLASSATLFQSYTKQIKELNDETDKLAAQKTQFETEKSDYLSLISDRDETISKITVKVTELSTKLEQHNDLKLKYDCLSEIEVRYKKTEQDISELKDQLRKACDLNDLEKAKRKKAVNDCTDLAQTFEVVNTKNTSLEEKVKTSEQQVVQLQADVAEKLELIRQLEKTVSNQAAAVTNLKANVVSASDLENEKAKNVKLTDLLKDLRSKADSANAAVTVLEDEHRALLIKNGDLEIQKTAIERNSEANKKTMKAFEDEYRKVQREKRNAISQKDEAMEKALIAEKDKMQAEKDAANSKAAYEDLKMKADKYKDKAQQAYSESNLAQENSKIREKLQKYYYLYENCKKELDTLKIKIAAGTVDSAQSAATAVPVSTTEVSTRARTRSQHSVPTSKDQSSSKPESEEPQPGEPETEDAPDCQNQ